jgi:hypothetical protein
VVVASRAVLHPVDAEVAVISFCISVAASNGGHSAAAAAGQSCLPAAQCIGQKSSWHNVQTSEQRKCILFLHLGHANPRLAFSHSSITPPHTKHLFATALLSTLAWARALHLALANGSSAWGDKYLGM